VSPSSPTYDRDLCVLLQDESWVNEISKMIFMQAYKRLRESADAADVTQTVLARLWEKCEEMNRRYEPNRGSWESYIFRVALNEVYAELRRRGRSTQLDEDEVKQLDGKSSWAENVQARIERNDLMEIVRECLATLKVNDQWLIQKKDIEERSWKEIKEDSKAMKEAIPEKSEICLRVRHHRAMQRLRSCVNQRLAL
jgi:RNA polymerase sigma factor (sigma-70 family)